ncbi:MAG TPA: folylpolyglutamate synthase/dihydrofolate synthase family protein [Desulfatiglandales bacterium]|nr:folylpolyglutamate synthase/dihydrofolate synthase family protein [Desulfatiglandales bacterium]
MKKYRTSYRESIKYLYGLQKYGVKFGLSKTYELMKRLGNPHHGKKYIHIAGTNGKGSVSAMLESILSRAGMKVGFYSSPHLVRFTERFRVNKKEISKSKIAELTDRLRDIIDSDNPPTYFEAATVMALTYFAEENTDISIMEVGMGGRLDATNIIIPLVSAITNISLEHQAFLGRRVIDIAGEKAGIIKKGVDTVTAATQPSVIRLFEGICAEKNAPFWRVGKDMRYRSAGSGLSYYGLKHTFRNLDAGLKGSYQKRNIALAIAIIELLEQKGFEISSRDIKEGLRETIWPGRLHLISKSPLIVLDGAHNPAGIRELAEAVEKAFSYNRLILIIGIMKDKDIGNMISRLVPMADYIICTSPNYYRSAESGDLMRNEYLHGRAVEAVPVISKAIERAKEMAGLRDMILITGSLFTIGEALTYFDPVKYKPDDIR